MCHECKYLVHYRESLYRIHSLALFYYLIIFCSFTKVIYPILELFIQFEKSLIPIVLFLCILLAFHSIFKEEEKYQLYALKKGKCRDQYADFQSWFDNKYSDLSSQVVDFKATLPPLDTKHKTRLNQSESGVFE